jgi:hypothetical protein
MISKNELERIGRGLILNIIMQFPETASVVVRMSGRQVEISGLYISNGTALSLQLSVDPLLIIRLLELNPVAVRSLRCYTRSPSILCMP